MWKKLALGRKTKAWLAAISAALASGSLCSCWTEPLCIRGIGPLDLDPTLHRGALVRRAPIVVVGSVLGYSRRKTSTVPDSREYPIEQRLIAFNIDKALKGKVSAGHSQIECNSYLSPGSISGLNIDYSYPEGRRIYFLENEMGQLRCFVDIYVSYLSVPASATPRILPAGLEESVIELILQPSGDVEAAEFTSPARLDAAVSLSMELLGRLATIERLRSLLSHSEATIARAACVSLIQHFRGQADCLQRLGVSLNVAERDLVGLRLSRTGEEDADALKGLSGNAESWLQTVAQSLDPKQLNDVLATLTLHSNQRIRDLACERLGRRDFTMSQRLCPSGHRGRVGKDSARKQ